MREGVLSFLGVLGSGRGGGAILQYMTSHTKINRKINDIKVLFAENHQLLKYVKCTFENFKLFMIIMINHIMNI